MKITDQIKYRSAIVVGAEKVRFQRTFECIRRVFVTDTERKIVPGSWTLVRESTITVRLSADRWNAKYASVSGGSELPGGCIQVQE